MGNPLLFVVCGVVLAFVVFESVVAMSRILRPARPVEWTPVCGVCEYDATGLESDVCPECGADLRVVGFGEREAGERGARNRRREFLNSVLGWSVLGVMLGVLGASVIAPQYVVPYAFGCTVGWIIVLGLMARAAGRREGR